MGRQKVLLPFGGQTVIERIVHALVGAGADDLIVVTGHRAQRVAAALKGLPVRIAFNTDYQRGMLSSVRCGLNAAAPATSAFMVALGDHPSITSRLVHHMITVAARRPDQVPSILVPTFGGRRGHPLIFTHHFKQQVLTRFDDTGLRGLLAANPAAVTQIPVAQASILLDMDSPEDYDQQRHQVES